MEEKLPGRPIKIIKSVENTDLKVFSEELYKAYVDDKEVVIALREIERTFDTNPDYELLHSLNEHLSISFRNVHTQQEIRFLTED